MGNNNERFSGDSLMDFLIETELNFKRIKFLNIYLDGIRVSRLDWESRQRQSVREYLASRIASWAEAEYEIGTASASVSIKHHVSFNVYLLTPYHGDFEYAY